MSTTTRTVAPQPSVQPRSTEGPRVEAGRYTTESILRSEFIYGKAYQGPGGARTTEKYMARLGLKPDMVAADIGCGSGGASFHLADRHGLNVTGVDNQASMISLCHQRLREAPNLTHKVQFIEGSPTDGNILPASSLDLIWNRDMLLYIDHALKVDVLTNFCNWLKPSGQIFITDFGMGPSPTSTYLDYVNMTGQYQDTMPEYLARLHTVGFDLTTAEDITAELLEHSEADLANFLERRQEFVDEWGNDHFSSLEQRWKQKIEAQRDGSMRWFLFIGHRRSSK